MYHRVAEADIFDISLDNWNIRPSRLERHFEWLAQNADCVPLTDIVQNRPYASKSKPLVALTFDDGFANFRPNVLPLLGRYRIPATLFVVTGYVGSPEPFPFDCWGLKNRFRIPEMAWRPINWVELKECLDSGLVSVGSHSHKHLNAISVGDDELAEEAEVSRECLRRHLGADAGSLYAYPYGSSRLGQVRPAYINAVRNGGYRMAVTTDLGLVRPETPPFQIPRVEVHAFDSPRILEEKVFGNLWPQRLCDRLRRAKRQTA